MNVPRKLFDLMVNAEMAKMPKGVKDLLYNLEIAVEDEPGKEAEGLGKDLLGLYIGLTRQEMMSPLSGPEPPARILLYHKNLQELAHNDAELRLEIGRTLRHEIAHHLGWTDEQLHEIWPEGC